jgi:protein-ribulosamine 3-kinase
MLLLCPRYSVTGALKAICNEKKGLNQAVVRFSRPHWPGCRCRRPGSQSLQGLSGCPRIGAMMSFPDRRLLAHLGRQLSGQPACDARPVGGGSMADTWRLEQGAEPAFLKLAAADDDMLAAEADGLAALAAAGAVRVPRVLGQGADFGYQWLLLEWLELEPLTAAVWEQFGRQLGEQHSRAADAFGWRRDNYIGATSQPNGYSRDWAGFYGNRRLGHQLALARRKGLPDSVATDVQGVMARVTDWLAPDTVPALLHGDLWSGNLSATGGRPVIYDPAVYCGDADADLAMLELFGAPPAGFWEAYQAVRPIAPGYNCRRELYNLYHLLNHFNLFGGGYASSAGAAAARLLEMPAP